MAWRARRERVTRSSRRFNRRKMRKKSLRRSHRARKVFPPFYFRVDSFVHLFPSVTVRGAVKFMPGGKGWRREKRGLQLRFVPTTSWPFLALALTLFASQTHSSILLMSLGNNRCGNRSALIICYLNRRRDSLH
jgi:hypothetical protein